MAKNRKRAPVTAKPKAVKRTKKARGERPVSKAPSPQQAETSTESPVAMVNGLQVLADRETARPVNAGVTLREYIEERRQCAARVANPPITGHQQGDVGAIKRLYISLNAMLNCVYRAMMEAGYRQARHRVLLTYGVEAGLHFELARKALRDLTSRGITRSMPRIQSSLFRSVENTASGVVIEVAGIICIPEAGFNTDTGLSELSAELLECQYHPQPDVRLSSLTQGVERYAILACEEWTEGQFERDFRALQLNLADEEEGWLRAVARTATVEAESPRDEVDSTATPTASAAGVDTDADLRQLAAEIRDQAGELWKLKTVRLIRDTAEKNGGGFKGTALKNKLEKIVNVSRRTIDTFLGRLSKATVRVLSSRQTRGGTGGYRLGEKFRPLLALIGDKLDRCD